MKTSRLLASVLILGSVLGSGTYGKTLEEETPTLVQTLAKQLVAKKRPKVATLDFTNIQGQPNELGRFLAEQLAVDMVMAEGITVIDRANINSVMAEHQLTAEGLVKPENAKKLGQFAGVDALLIGNLAAMDNVFTLTVKAISTETAEVVAAGRMKFDVTQDSMKQFGTVLSGGAPVAMAGGNTTGGTPSSQDFSGIATKRFDNLEVVLKSVIPSSKQTERGNAIPVVRCSFELVNRDLRNTLIIAANSTKVDEDTTIQICGYRGGLSDSKGKRWWIPSGQLKGLSAVLCCDATHLEGYLKVRVQQSNPSAVVDYVKKGTKCEMGDTRYQDTLEAQGKFWTGSFSTLPPGKSIQAIAEFVPEENPNDEKGPTTIPQSFQLDMELVLGSVANGENPEQAKDLRLENLTFDKIVMPTAAAKQ